MYYLLQAINEWRPRKKGELEGEDDEENRRWPLEKERKGDARERIKAGAGAEREAGEDLGQTGWTQTPSLEL